MMRAAGGTPPWLTAQSVSGVNLVRSGGERMRDLLNPIYPDPETETLITGIAPPNDRGKTNYRVLIGAMKKLGVWSSLANGFLFGSSHQPSAATQKSIKGGNDATGTGTQAPYYVGMNGTTNKFDYTGTGNATVTAKTVIVVFADTNTASGHTSHIWSLYSGGVSKGPAIYSGGSTITGTSGTTNTIFAYGSADGSTNTSEITTANATFGGVKFVALRQIDGRQVLTVHGKSQTYATLANLWANATNRTIGASAAAGQFLAGRLYAVLEFDAALTDAQLDALTNVLRYLFGNAVGAGRYLAFEGNSLTASASGGGTSWPTKLLAKAAWTSAFKADAYSNCALDGSYASLYGEQTYYTRTASWKPVVGERNILFVWEGINDITASVATSTIIAALDRHLAAAAADGWEVYVLPLTPVADTGAGLSYGYTAAQQQALTDVNTYLASVGGPRYGTYLDIRAIGATYPKFLDPTDSTYYTAGDGLHHNDAGRTLIADYVASIVTP